MSAHPVLGDAAACAAVDRALPHLDGLRPAEWAWLAVVAAMKAGATGREMRAIAAMVAKAAGVAATEDDA